jgi:UDP-glucose 4-epimerase
LDGARALVTGADGFLGRSLVARLHHHGAEVHVVSRRPRTAKLRRQGERSYTWHRGDLAEWEFVRRTFQRAQPDLVFHLGAHVAGAPDRDLVFPTLRSNVLGTVNTLQGAADVDADRVVMTGTMMEPQPFAADDVPGSPYAMSKWAAAQYARMFHTLYGVPVVHLRLFMTFGPGVRDPGKLLNHVALSALNGNPARVSSGRWSTDWIFCEDVLDALVQAALAPAAVGSSVDVGTGTATTLGEVVTRFANLISPGAEVQFDPERDRPFEFERVADPDTWQQIGWQPSTPLDDGLEQTAAWFREQYAAAEPSPLRH